MKREEMTEGDGGWPIPNVCGGDTDGLQVNFPYRELNGLWNWRHHIRARRGRGNCKQGAFCKVSLRNLPFPGSPLPLSGQLLWTPQEMFFLIIGVSDMQPEKTEEMS